MTGRYDGGDLVSYRRSTAPVVRRRQDFIQTIEGELDERGLRRAPDQYVPEAQPVNKTTLAVMALAIVLAAVVVIVIASLMFVSCNARPVVPPPPNVHNPNCTSWCLG